MGFQNQTIKELINKINYNTHMSEVGHKIMDEEGNVQTIFGKDALKMLNHNQHEKLLTKKLLSSMHD